MSPYHGEYAPWETPMLEMEQRYKAELKKLRKRIKKLERALQTPEAGDA